MLKKPVIPLHQIRKKNFKISEMKRNQNVRKVKLLCNRLDELFYGDNRVKRPIFSL